MKKKDILKRDICTPLPQLLDIRLLKQYPAPKIGIFPRNLMLGKDTEALVLVRRNCQEEISHSSDNVSDHLVRKTRAESDGSVVGRTTP